MVDPTPSDYHLSYLRDRWERDRSSRVFLQLAEEYRRRGLHSEALEVLEAGLSFHPGYLAAQVALGRCRMEAGQLAAAVPVLEAVLTQDPSQAVAIRLLVEALLRMGDADRARAAIDRCRLLGVARQELEAYEVRLSELRQSLAPPVEETPAEEATVEALGPVEPEVDDSWSVMDAVAASASQAEAPTAEAVAAAAFEPHEEPAAIEETSETAASPSEAVAPAPHLPEPSGQIFRLPALAPAPLRLPLRASIAGRRVVVAGREPFALAPVVALSSMAASGDVFQLGVAGMAAGATASVAVVDTAVLEPPPVAAGLALAPSAPDDVLSGEPVEAIEPAADAEPFEAAMEPLDTAPEPLPAPEPTAVAGEPVLAAAPEPAATQWASELPVVAAIGEPEIDRAFESAALPEDEATAEPLAMAEVSADLDVAPVAEAEPEPAQPSATAPWSAPGSAAATVRLPFPPVAAPAEVPAAPLGFAPPTSIVAESGQFDVQASGALPAPELRPSDPGTATLGDLYLRQGYLGEAEKIFREVLARDPENEAALRGMETIGKRRAASISATDLLTGDEREISGASARKILLLKRYVNTLRRGAQRDVP